MGMEWMGGPKVPWGSIEVGWKAMDGAFTAPCVILQ